MRITSIINGKGGVGKTTTTQALATGLDKSKYKTLAIDYDPQGNLSMVYGANVTSSPTMFHIMSGEVAINEAIQHTPQGDIIVGNASLTKIQSLYEDMFEGFDKLKDQLESFDMGYTHVFIDNQPLIVGLLTRQTLFASNDLIIPMMPDILAVQGLTSLQKAIEGTKKMGRPDLKVNGILFTKHNPRTLIGSQIGQKIREWARENDTKVYNTFIRESVSIREAQAKRRSIYDYAPKSNPVMDYMAFISEYLSEERG